MDLFSLSDKTALVTGASSGLGRHFAKVLSQAGADVVLAASAQPSIDYVLIGRHTTATRPWPLLLKDLETAVGRIQIDMTTSAKNRRQDDPEGGA